LSSAGGPGAEGLIFVGARHAVPAAALGKSSS
jgi:hypothetical protein